MKPNDLAPLRKPEFKLVPCECCQYPIAVPADASASVCFACPQCGHRACG